MTVPVHTRDDVNDRCPRAVVTPFNGSRIPVSVSAVSMSTGKTELIDLQNEALAELFRYEDEVNEDDD